MRPANCWWPGEIEIASDREWAAPFWDVDVDCTLTSTSGRVVRSRGFWDGGKMWRVRAQLDGDDAWTWRTRSNDLSLNDRMGTLNRPPTELDRFALHGPIQVAPEGHVFEHADGTPFFWLGDTVWNGLMRSSVADWNAYLRVRAEQGFTVVQVFTLPWRALTSDADGHTAWLQGTEKIIPDPRYFTRLDNRVSAANRHGLLVSAIVFLALYDEDEGQSLPVEGIERYADWLRARWAAFNVAWTLGGDGDFTGSRADRWRQIGRTVYQDPCTALVTMHPQGRSWPGEEFRNESWMTFSTYQSGHGGDERTNRWHIDGPYSHEWEQTPARPVINIEPNYEDHPAVSTGIPFTPADVRRGAYWSVLGSGTAGVGYGQYSLWAWADEPEIVGEAIKTQRANVLEPWRTVVDRPGAHSMGIMHTLLRSGPWWQLRPGRAVLADQPSAHDATLHQAVARTTTGDWTVIYAPRGSARIIVAGEVCHARWFDPRSGHWLPATGQTADPLPTRTESATTFVVPDENDWVLDIREHSSEEQT